jgi:hypothetical protein
MKKQALTFVGVLSLLLVAGSAFAQQKIQSNVPFSFTVNKTVLPAGAYTISPIGTSGILVLKGDDNKTINAMSPHAVESLNPADRTKLVFHCYGREHCFLYEVWVQGESRGRQFPKSAVENELAARLRSEKVAIMASTR